MASQFTDFKNFLKAGPSKSILSLTSSIFKLSWKMKPKFDSSASSIVDHCSAILMFSRADPRFSNTNFFEE